MSDTRPSDGDEPTIERLLEEHLGSLRAFLRLRAGAGIRARLGHSDLVQSVCREVLQSRDKIEFQGDAAFRSWLYTAALRKLVEHDRRMHAGKRDVGREQDLDAEGGVDAAVLQGYATLTTPSLVAMGREGAAKLEEAFDALTDEHREVITLARVVGLSHAEIAAQLGKTEESCRQLLRRALVKLSIELDQRGIVL
ncbi:MAG: sigma-70 family RNA polymerase sigma factor [Planctomycetota bacterium]